MPTYCDERGVIFGAAYPVAPSGVTFNLPDDDDDEVDIDFGDLDEPTPIIVSPGEDA